MKKMLALTLALLMLFAAASCASVKKPTREEPTATQKDDQTQAPTTTAKEDVTTHEPWRPPVITTEENQGGESGPEIDPLAAPTALPNGAPMEIVPISDGTMQKEDGVAIGKWASELTDKTTSIFDDGKTVKASDYAGFLVKVTTENGNGVYVRFRIKVKNGEEIANIEIKGNNRTIGWYREGKWNDFQGAASNWVTPASTGGYVYLPFAVLTEIDASAEIADFQVYSSNGSNRIGVFSDWSFVKATGEGDETPVVDNKPTVPELAAPTKLADNTAITLVPVSDGILSAAGTNASGYASNMPYQTTSIFKDGAKINPADYRGMMIKIATTTENHMGLYLRFFFKLADGTEIEIKALGRSFYFYNGETWQTCESGETATNWVSPAETVGYVYFAFPFAEITSSEIADIRIYSSGSANRLGTFSDWSLVQTVAG